MHLVIHLGPFFFDCGKYLHRDCNDSGTSQKAHAETFPTPFLTSSHISTYPTSSSLINSSFTGISGASFEPFSQRTARLCLYLDIAGFQDREGCNSRPRYIDPSLSDPLSDPRSWMEGSSWQRRHIVKGITVLEFHKCCIMHSAESERPFD